MCVGPLALCFFVLRPRAMPWAISCRAVGAWDARIHRLPIRPLRFWKPVRSFKTHSARAPGLVFRLPRAMPWAIACRTVGAWDARIHRLPIRPLRFWKPVRSFKTHSARVPGLVFRLPRAMPWAISCRTVGAWDVPYPPSPDKTSQVSKTCEVF